MQIQELTQWLEERQQNCIRIAHKKCGEERAGWLEDCAYFTAAIGAIKSAYGPSETVKWEDERCKM